MQAEFRAPRRRSRVFEAYEGPLPVGRCTDAQRTFRGDLINQQVLVCHPDHIQKIHSQVTESTLCDQNRRLTHTGSDDCVAFQGFFGKGILSRARPDRGISDRWESELTSSRLKCHRLFLAESAGISLFQITKVCFYLSSPSPGQ